MKFYECSLSNDSSTTKMADEIFKPENGYTGVIFDDSVTTYVSNNRSVNIKLIANIMWKNDYFKDYWKSYYCTMTELKSYLTGSYLRSETPDKLIKNNPLGMGFIRELEEVMKKIDKVDETGVLVKKFSSKYPVHVQRTCDLRSYGEVSGPYLLMEYYMIDCTSDLNFRGSTIKFYYNKER